MSLTVFLVVTKTLFYDYALASLPRVFITINSNALATYVGGASDKYVQINWYNAQPKANDWIGLFNNDPVTTLSTPVYKTPVQSIEGLVNTNVNVRKTNFHLPLKQHCLHFWIAYVSNNQVISSNCFKTQPNWMWENHNLLGKMSLAQMMIPGTHDSACFRPYNGSMSENIFNQYAVTQSYDFWDQLVFGIRSLDMRIGYFAKNNTFRLVHGPLFFGPLYEQVVNVKNFVNSTKEIVILDLHRLVHGFVPATRRTKRKDDLHDSLISLLVSELGDFLIPRDYGYNVTLDTLWKNNKRILLSCNFLDYYKTNPYLWPGIHQVWTTTQSIDYFFEFFDGVIEKPVNYSLWSTQAAMSANVKNWLKPFDVLNKKDDRVNPLITKHARELWWDKANVVATNFFEENNVIDVSIESNIKRAKKMIVKFIM